MLTNPEQVQEMDPKTQEFIQDIVDYELTIIPHTAKSFRLLAAKGSDNYTEDFTAANCKGPSGTFKLASLINYIYLCNM